MVNLSRLLAAHDAIYDATEEQDELTQLLRDQEKARARVVGAAQIALWFLEAQSLDETEKVLKTALDDYKACALKVLEYRKRSSQPNNSRTAA